MAESVDHTHGDTGVKPAQDLNFQDGDYPDPEVFDWFWSEVPAAINDHASTIESIAPDSSGEVDSATKVKGNDIDSDGDGVVDEADYANDADASTYKGNDIDSDGDGVVDEAEVANNTRTNSEIRSAVDDEVSQAATSVSGLDGQVATNESDITALEEDLAGYEIQKDGVDGAGIINFKTK